MRHMASKPFKKNKVDWTIAYGQKGLICPLSPIGEPVKEGTSAPSYTYRLTGTGTSRGAFGIIYCSIHIQYNIQACIYYIQAWT